MFTAELSDTSLLKDSLQSISNIITEGVFRFDEEGIDLVAADPAMVAMVDFHLDADAFDSYDCEEETHLGLNIEDLYSILRRAGSGDTVRLAPTDDGGKLRITITNASTRTFSLALLNLDENDVPEIDDLDFTVTADLQTATLENAVGDAAVVGDAVTVAADPDALHVRAEGDSSDIEFTIEKGSDGLIDLDAETAAESMFALDYLNKMVKAKKLADTVTVRLGDDFPMRLDFKVPETLELGYVLAPRIEE